LLDEKLLAELQFASLTLAFYHIQDERPHFLSFRLANPYMRRGSLKNASIKSLPLKSPIRRAFLMIWMTCGKL